MSSLPSSRWSVNENQKASENGTITNNTSSTTPGAAKSQGTGRFMTRKAFT